MCNNIVIIVGSSDEQDYWEIGIFSAGLNSYLLRLTSLLET